MSADQPADLMALTGQIIRRCGRPSITDGASVLTAEASIIMDQHIAVVQQLTLSLPSLTFIPVFIPLLQLFSCGLPISKLVYLVY